MKSLQKQLLHKLYLELVKLQKDIILNEKKVLILFEGRDTSGKDGVIKRITKHLSPRDTTVVALGKPTETEMHQWYFQRYIEELPARGEISLFNRSWYNRAGVEHVMGFCTPKQYEDFFEQVELFERMLISSDFIVLKYYLDINIETQAERLEARRTNPLKQWKISPIDNKALEYWDKYTEARNNMLERTNYSFAPWKVVDANKKVDARISVISNIISSLDYQDKEIIESKYIQPIVQNYHQNLTLEN